MGKLRKTVQKEVLDSIDSSIFSSDDFDIQFGDPDDEQWLVHIIFSHDSNFTYSIDTPEKYSSEYIVQRSPGVLQENEYKRYDSFKLAVEAIPLWCTEVRNELKASKPIYKEVDELRKIIEEQFSCSVKDNDEFSVAEINDLNKKFDALQKRVDQLEKDKIITERQLGEFTAGIKQVSEDLEIYPKQTWLKTSTNKIVKLVTSIGKSSEGRKILTDGARKLLGLD